MKGFIYICGFLIFICDGKIIKGVYIYGFICETG